MLPFPNLINRKRDQSITLGRYGKYRFHPRFRVSHNVRKYHTYVVGLTGRGKSKFLQNCLVQDILAGRGCAVIDPHGDLAKDVLRSLISKGYFDQPGNYHQVVYVSPRRRDHIIPFNVLARPDGDTETYEIAQRVIAAFQRTWAQTLAEPPRFQQIMRAALAVLIENGETLCNLYQLLTDDDYRLNLLAHITDDKVAVDCNAFFENEFEQWGRDRPKMIASTTNKVSALTDNPSTFYMLGQKENHLNIREIMDQGKVLFIDLGECDHETKKLFGTLIVTGFEQAALSRARAPKETRTPYYLYIDEFQDFACHPGAAETFSQMLSQVRKFGLHLVLANQSIAQLSQRLQNALSNAQTMVAFRISRSDAEVLARIIGKIDLQAVKRESQTDVQHPVYSTLQEQWEGFIQHLTTQQVRQVTVKTADDRMATIWPEMIKEENCTDQELEGAILKLLQIHGKPFKLVNQGLNVVKLTDNDVALFTH